LETAALEQDTMKIFEVPAWIGHEICDALMVEHLSTLRYAIFS